ERSSHGRTTRCHDLGPRHFGATVKDRLSDVLSEFARTLVTDFPIQAILDHLVERIVEVLPISGAGVTLISPGTDPRYVAASDELALRFEQLQSEFNEGPCLLTFETGEPVMVPDLREDQRFPTFGPHAVAAGLVAVFTFPLRHGGERLGALDLYRTTPGQLDSDAVAAAQTLADVTSAYVLNARARVDLLASNDEALQHSLHDALTGLPNRTLLVERLDHAMSRCHRTNKMVAILFADLDSFKLVNDTYGHHAGDELLVAVSRRLTRLLRAGDTLARLGGDEFLILCEDLDSESQAQDVAERIRVALIQPFRLVTAEVRVSASVGIAFAGRPGDMPEQVLREADTAMYQAKRSGGAHHGILDRRAQRLDDRRNSLYADLGQAISRGELRLDYQPIVTTSLGRVDGVEALLRWDHPVHGLLGPGTVIPLAEESGLITSIGHWVLERTCSESRRWRTPRHKDDLRMSVNVSPTQLLASGFVESVGQVLADSGTNPSLVILEITESALFEDIDRAIQTLEELRQIGVALALDDFGTGFSSLNYLRRLPIDLIKIDRTFIADIDTEPDTRVIVGAIVDLAHGLGMTVVAEGVETSEQHQHVAALGCELCQGFLFARPMPSVQIDALLNGQRSADASVHPIVRPVAEMSLLTPAGALQSSPRNPSLVPLPAGFVGARKHPRTRHPVV
ncbi:MAG: EAL domain-containing protein, partial [Ilumatobacteraceae bacterium]